MDLFKDAAEGRATIGIRQKVGDNKMIKEKCILTKVPTEKSDGLRMLIIVNAHYANKWKMHYHLQLKK